MLLPLGPISNNPTVSATVADRFATSVSTADVRTVTGGGSPSSFVSNTVAVIANWAGAEQVVRWNNALIQPGTVVHVTSLTPARIRVGIPAQAAGYVDIQRSSGSTSDEAFCAMIGGTP